MVNAQSCEGLDLSLEFPLPFALNFPWGILSSTSTVGTLTCTPFSVNSNGVFRHNQCMGEVAGSAEVLLEVDSEASSDESWQMLTP